MTYLYGKSINNELDLEKIIPRPVPKINGFYFIPDYSDYAISKNGVVVNIVKFKEVNSSFLKSGYKQVNINGHNKRLSRLIGKTFIGRPSRHLDKDFIELTINHIDGNKINDTVDNLEWVTNAENVLHAHRTGLCDRDKPTLAINLITDKIIYYHSSKECADYFKIHRATFYKKLTEQVGRFRIGGFTMCFEEDVDLIENKNKILSLPDFKTQDKRFLNVKVFDKKSKIITIYENLSKACIKLKLPISTVFRYLVKKYVYENDDVIVSKL
jgi:hypothetical protein